MAMLISEQTSMSRHVPTQKDRQVVRLIVRTCLHKPQYGDFNLTKAAQLVAAHRIRSQPNTKRRFA